MNVYFTEVSKFEYTPELNVFDAFGVSLYHGWIVDPQDRPSVIAIGDASYNQIIAVSVQSDSSDAPSDLTAKKSVIANFLESSAHQLTFAGLWALHETLADNKVCAFFRNNHFSTMLKYNGKLYLLVTDAGYEDEPLVVWELLDDISG